jgi:hypothetical protein
MKIISLRAICGLALTVFLVISATQLSAAGPNGKAKRLEGTWSVQVTARNCDTGAEIITFPAKTTFLAGGDTILTPSVSSPFLRSTGHGVWEHSGGRSFANTVELFVYAQDHTFVGIERVTQNIELSEGGDAFTSTNRFELPLPNGQVMRGCSTAVGRRLE